MAVPRRSVSDRLPASPSVSASLARFSAALFLTLGLAAGVLPADAGAPESASVDVDADFARAADLLEAGQRAEAEALLDAIPSRQDQPAWDARAALLLAAADGRRRDFPAA